MNSPLLRIKDGLHERLKEARMLLGLKQSQLAEAGQVSRLTQISYEAGTTSPNTAYLERVQDVGLNIPYLLFGQDAMEQLDSPTGVNWPLLRQAHEEVEFFCIKAAPNCPPSYRWQLIQKVYTKLVSLNQASDVESPAAPQEIVRNAWEST